MQEVSISIKIKPNKEDMDSDYVFSALFPRKPEQGILAKKIFMEMATTGVIAEFWEANAEKLGISPREYYWILKTLKKTGLAYKTKGIYHASRKLAKHLGSMSSALHNLCNEQGVPQ